MISLLPYAELDGIRTIPDSGIKELFTRTQDEGFVPIVFYEGTIQTPEEFLYMAKAPDTLFYVLREGGKTAGYVWLNRPENRTMRLHFCVFKESWNNAVFLARHALNKIINMKTREGDFLFDLLVGFIPEWNNRAIKFALACGCESHGIIPNAIFNSRAGESEPAAFLYYRRKDEDD